MKFLRFLFHLEIYTRVDTEGGIIYFGDDGTGHWSCFFVLCSCIDCVKIEGEKE